MSSNKESKIEVFNVNTPGKSNFVQKDKYDEVRKILLKHLPAKEPGLTQNEMMILVESQVSEEIFPKKETSGWWMKTVQLDLEARGLLIRKKSKPTRWFISGNQEEKRLVADKKKEPKPHPVNKMGNFIKDRLIQEDLMKEYESRPYYQRNDYLSWINQAKLEKTRKKRLDQMIEELRTGSLYMNMEYKEKK